jgi:hypothetical protein
MDLYDVTNVIGLPDYETKLLHDLIIVWEQKRGNNQKRVEYYLGHNSLDNLGIAIPKEMEGKLKENIGWATKAVNSLAVRSRFDGFVFDGKDDFGIERILSDNNFKPLYSQTVTSELINSCAFMTVSKGREGEPDVLVNAYSALTASAMWDMRNKCISCGLTVVDVKQNPLNEMQDEPVWVNLYTKTHVWEIRREDVGQPWYAYGNEHKMGRPLIEPLVYKRELLRPFGRSRISRAVMSIVDNAVRTQARAELCAEFYSRPQRYLLGASDDAFEDKTKWEAYTGSIFAVSKDDDGDTPQYGQLASASMQPHLDQLRILAAQFAGETNIPLSELGVISDNPSSADAIYAAKEALIIEAEDLNASNGDALKNVGKMIIAILQNKKFSELGDKERTIQSIFKSPDRQSPSAQADATSKMIASIPWMANTEVILEFLGFNEEQRTRMKSDKEKYEAQQAIYNAMALNATQQTQEVKGQDDTSTNAGGNEQPNQPVIRANTEVAEG